MDKDMKVKVQHVKASKKRKKLKNPTLPASQHPEGQHNGSSAPQHPLASVRQQSSSVSQHGVPGTPGTQQIVSSGQQVVGIVGVQQQYSSGQAEQKKKLQAQVTSSEVGLVVLVEGHELVLLCALAKKNI